MTPTNKAESMGEVEEEMGSSGARVQAGPDGPTDDQRELEWDTAPLGEVLWGVYGPDSFPSVFACKILDHPEQGRVLWGFSIYRRSPGFRTLGVSSLWAEQHGLHLFQTQAAAFSFIAGLFAKAVQS